VISPKDKDKVLELLRSISNREPQVYDLGTPELVEGPEIEQLIAMGPHIVPYLLELAQSEEPRQVAYIIRVLRNLGDRKTIEALRALKSQYQAKEPKTPWDWAVIGQANLAMDALSKI
jgi:hypothetical protein